MNKKFCILMYISISLIPELQIRMGTEDNSKIMFLISYSKTYVFREETILIMGL